MAESLRFYSYLQRGLSLSINQEADQYGRPTQANNHLSFGLRLKGGYDDIHHSFEMRGPGDIIGIDKNQIRRIEPKAGTPDFEPNFFPFIEFLSAELPWAYSFTNKSSNGRLRPWLALIVLDKLADYSFSPTGHGGNGLLSIKSDAGKILPNLQDLYAWAHVQQSALNDNAASADMAQTYNSNPESFLSRLICPVRLKKNTAYQAFLVPCFEAGRMAGLGQDVDTANFNDAWTDASGALDLPVYYQWTFMTANADLEELLRRLTPYPADNTVGLNDLDLSNPRGGLDVSQLGNLPDDARHPITSFKGALISPAAEPKSPHPQHTAAFEQALGDALLKTAQMPEDQQHYNPLEHDPVITPPLYGNWQNPAQAKTAEELPVWMREANLSADQRAIAGVGADVIRLHQEDYMAQAWEHARNVRDIQIELHKTRLALAVSEKIHKKISTLSDQSVLQLSNNMHRRLSATSDNKTIFSKIRDSAFIPTGVTDSQMRRQSARQHKILRKLYPQANQSLEQTKISGKIIQACIQPTKALKTLATFKPSSFMSFDTQYEAVEKPPTPARGNTRQTTKKTKILSQSSRNIGMSAATLSPVKALPIANGSALEKGSVDKDLNLTAIVKKIREKTNPYINLKNEAYKRISGLAATKPAAVPIPKLAEIPLEFDEPAYKKLLDMNPEFFMPGFGSIPDNTASLLSINPKFIESYLLGLNHEMSRELAWREYPAKLNGTWFKKFWDYAGKPQQTDIGNIHEWTKKSKLGEHAYGFEPGQKQSRPVLLIKGDLLRRYPNLMIYAVQASWKAKRDIKNVQWTLIDPQADAIHGDVARYADVAKEKIELPVFRGKIADSAHFLGFNLDIVHMMGSVNKADDSAGWFFVFEEHISEPHFGLDMARPDGSWGSTPENLQDFSWNNVSETQAHLDNMSCMPLTVPWLLNKKIENVRWGENSAQMARITYQKPVRIMIHADSLIQQEKA